MADIKTHQCHDFSNRSLHVALLTALDSDHVYRLANRGQHDVGRVGHGYLADSIDPMQHDAVNLGRRRDCFQDAGTGPCSKLVKLAFRVCYLLNLLGRYDDIVQLRYLSAGAPIVVKERKRGGEVYRSAGGGFNQLNVAPVSTAEALLQRMLYCHAIHDASELRVD